MRPFVNGYLPGSGAHVSHQQAAIVSVIELGRHGIEVAAAAQQSRRRIVSDLDCPKRLEGAVIQIALVIGWF